MSMERAKRLMVHYFQDRINGDSDYQCEVEEIIEAIVDEAVQQLTEADEPIPMVNLSLKKYEFMKSEIHRLRAFQKALYACATVDVKRTSPETEDQFQTTITVDKTMLLKSLSDKHDVRGFDSLDQCLEYSHGVEIRWEL